ncbi:hypothetical protein [Acidipila sp. EB88]|uniref:hypothetical protein n=1 Tax=Acidipila sp. EB88 TaxID=2305226 RepID=UPI000F602E1B|nr:hypothetical protein [Acidipila sp. EB88]RRA48567.1 hypothetical protein D1Y84_09995 [Acidipila sp. EB88]
MRTSYLVSTLALASCVLLSGCSSKKAASKDNFKKTIGNYYNAHAECVWSSSIKFPIEADPKSGDQTAGYDALTDAGLLTRTSAQKKVFIFGSKQVNDYDLSAKGRSTWTPDPQQPGYGNFCFGHREVTSIDNYTTSDDSKGAQVASVDYHYTIGGVADWAKTTEMQTAFPTIQADLSGAKVDKANLINTDDGWQVSHD